MFEVFKNQNPANSSLTWQQNPINENEIGKKIEKHVRSIEHLISKLGKKEKQEYFTGFLAHILANIKFENPPPSPVINSKMTEKDYSKLSEHELALLEELNSKMEELYRTMDDNPMFG